MLRSSRLAFLPTLALACEPAEPSGQPLGPEVEATVAYGPYHVCEAPLDRMALGPFERRTRDVPSVSRIWTWAGGITVADLNADGWLDTLSPVEPGLELYPGSAEPGFASIGEEVFGDLDLSYASGTSVADYDGDGDLDIYVTRIRGLPITTDVQTPNHGRNVLLRNEGDGQTFTDVTEEAGGVHACGIHHRTGDESCFRSMTSSWADYDGDGDLDLFVGNYGYVDETPGTRQEDMAPAEPSFLYANNGDGTFTDVSDELPDALHDGYTYAGGFVDLDGDLDPDLYTVNDFGRVAANTVLWNEGGELVYDPVGGQGLAIPVTGMGMGVSDFNHDGLIDVVIPQWAGVVLLESRASGWFDGADAAGMTVNPERNQVVGWGAETGDIDNDGDVDVLVQYGFLPNENREVWSNPIEQADALYLNESTVSDDGVVTLRFRDAAQNWVFADPASTRGTAVADLNRDGWLDVGKRNLSGPSVVYLSRCGEQTSLTVHLRQPGTMNHFGVGAVVSVRTRDRVQRKPLIAGGTGYASSQPLELHFGLGDAGIAERVEVTWPDGAYSVVDYVPAMQEITITRDL